MANNWRDENDYAYFDDLNVSGLAWECLRRNAQYQAAFPNLTQSDAETWGLRFPD